MMPCAKDDMMSLPAWLDYLEHRYEEEIHLGLDRIREVASRMDLLSPDVPVIMVGGTNGKGSTVTALETIYSTAGYRVGCYTSPHLLMFNERIRVNQKPITDADLCHAFAVVEDSRQEIALTYFEMTTLAGLFYFKRAALDVIILEVGLGGRLDATNIIDADLSILTTIDLDHQAFLGHDKESIAYEKAGILRPGQKCIYADNNIPQAIVNEAIRLNVSVWMLGRDYFYTCDEHGLHMTATTGRTLDVPQPCLHLHAAVAAWMTTELLASELPVRAEDLTVAMQKVRIPGRQQIQEGAVTTLYDVAHNPQAVRCLAEKMATYPLTTKCHAVFSGLKDKDLCGLIQPMRAYIDAWYPAILNTPRAASEDLLRAAFQAELGDFPLCFSHPVAAYQAAYDAAKPGDVIVVYGSFLMVSAVMEGMNEVLI